MLFQSSGGMSLRVVGLLAALLVMTSFSWMPEVDFFVGDSCDGIPVANASSSFECMTAFRGPWTFAGGLGSTVRNVCPSATSRNLMCQERACFFAADIHKCALVEEAGEIVNLAAPPGWATKYECYSLAEISHMSSNLAGILRAEVARLHITAPEQSIRVRAGGCEPWLNSAFVTIGGIIVGLSFVLLVPCAISIGVCLFCECSRSYVIVPALCVGAFAVVCAVTNLVLSVFVLMEGNADIRYPEPTTVAMGCVMVISGLVWGNIAVLIGPAGVVRTLCSRKGNLVACCHLTLVWCVLSVAVFLIPSVIVGIFAWEISYGTFGYTAGSLLFVFGLVGGIAAIVLIIIGSWMVCRAYGVCGDPAVMSGAKANCCSRDSACCACLSSCAQSCRDWCETKKTNAAIRKVERHSVKVERGRAAQRAAGERKQASETKRRLKHQARERRLQEARDKLAAQERQAEEEAEEIRVADLKRKVEEEKKSLKRLAERKRLEQELEEIKRMRLRAADDAPPPGKLMPYPSVPEMDDDSCHKPHPSAPEMDSPPLAVVSVVPKPLSSPEEEGEVEDDEAEGEDLPESETCVVCMERKKTILLQPCRHLCMCKKCAPKVKLCPLCRTQVEDRIAVFV